MSVGTKVALAKVSGKINRNPASCEVSSSFTARPINAATQEKAYQNATIISTMIKASRVPF